MAEYTQTYWNELIDKYRNGTISDKDRFQLEKEALDDPFLFDALEGFALHGDVQQDKKEEKKSVKIFTLPRIAVAASAIFLIAVMFNLNSNRGTSESQSDNAIAMVLDGDEKEAISEKETKVEIETGDGIVSTTEKKTNQESNTAKNKKQSPPKVEVENEQGAKSNQVQKESAPIAPKPAQDYTKVEEEIKVITEIESSESGDMNDGNIGKIASSENEPTAVDESMNQVIVEADDLANAESIEEAIEKDKNEVVVVDSDLAMNKSNKRKKVGGASFYTAVPVIGKEIFDDFARESIDKRGLRQEQPQEVTIEFKIDKNGNLSDFHHIFTGCPECGPYAISLLQKSGEWKTVPPGYFGKARYTFTF